MSRKQGAVADDGAPPPPTVCCPRLELVLGYRLPETVMLPLEKSGLSCIDWRSTTARSGRPQSRDFYEARNGAIEDGGRRR